MPTGQVGKVVWSHIDILYVMDISVVNHSLLTNDFILG